MGTIIILMRWNAKKSKRYNRHSAIFCSNHFCFIQILNNFDNGHLFCHPLKKQVHNESFNNKIFPDFALFFFLSSRIRISFHLMNLRLFNLPS
jgi:hypothetical protein